MTLFQIPRFSLKSVPLLLGLLYLAPNAWADSDAMYCLGDGYLAYELRHFDSDGQHTLYIVRPAKGDDIVSVSRFKIPSNISQVHGVMCEKNNVLISAFEKAVMFNVSSETFTPDQDKVVTAGQNILDLKSNPYSPVQALDGWGNEDYQYQLHNFFYTHPEDGANNGIIEHHSISRIVRINLQGHYMDGSHSLTERMRIETID